MRDPQTAKADLRAQALQRRDALAADIRAAAAEAVAERPFLVALAKGAIVSGFFAIKTEINPMPLMRKLAGAGAQLALPVIAGRGRPLILRAWTFGDAMKRGPWGIREPEDSAAEVDPDIMLVPLAAFDRRGQRIGYGAGYYDMTIARIRATKRVVTIGLAFAAQEIERVPSTPLDQPLDLMLTEREVIDFRTAA